MSRSRTKGAKISPEPREEIIRLIDERIREAHVTREDFNELKHIVKDLALSVKNLSEKVEALAEAQRRTEEEIQKLSRELLRTRQELGGLSKSMSYAFENEAYRYLPKVLKEKYGITVTERFIRTEVRGKEINFFAKAHRNGAEVFIVGEAKLRLDDTKKRDDAVKELEEKVKAVREEFGEEVEIVKLLVTHYATKGFLEKAKKHNIIVIQSFEW